MKHKILIKSLGMCWAYTTALSLICAEPVAVLVSSVSSTVPLLESTTTITSYMEALNKAGRMNFHVEDFIIIRFF